MPTDPVTVPASVLEALGGLTEDDPPVAYRCDGAYGFHGSPGPGFGKPGPLPSGSVLLLPVSAPTLRRVLARHLGMTLGPGEVPQWYRYHAAPPFTDWRLKLRHQERAIGWGFAPEGDRPCNAHLIRTRCTDGITDPMAALVAVLIHVAEEAHNAD